MRIAKLPLFTLITTNSEPGDTTNISPAIEKRRGAAKSPWIRTISARLKHSDSPTQSLCTAYMIDRVAMAAQDIFADIEEANDRYTHIERIVMDPFFNEACGNPIVVINELYVSAEHRQEKVGTSECTSQVKGLTKLM